MHACVHACVRACDCVMVADVIKLAQEDMDGWTLFNGLYTTL